MYNLLWSIFYENIRKRIKNSIFSQYVPGKSWSFVDLEGIIHGNVFTGWG
jgi:hypothetical protein